MIFFRAILFASAVLFAGQLARGQAVVWTYHNDNQRTGLNARETILNLANVNSNRFGKLFAYTVDGDVYAQPLYVPNVTIAGRGGHNTVFVATEHNTVYALDADSAGAAGGMLWKTNLGPAAVTTIPGVFTNRNFGTREGAFVGIMPEIGITGTPVIDTNSGTLYVDAFTGEIGGGVTNYFHRLHALNLTNGTEQPFSPVVVSASVAGTGVDSSNGVVTFNPKQHIQRCALTLAGGIVYLAYAGYADTDPYHGWIIGFNATNLAPLTNYVFNTTPNSTIAAFGPHAGEGGIWMAGGGLAVDENTNLYFAVGNGSFNVTNHSGNTEYGNSFMKLSTTNGLAVADYFTPWNQSLLQDKDLDLGSGGLLLLPDQPGRFPHELLGAGKQGEIYMLNRDQFTIGDNHFDATNVHDFVAQTNLGKIANSFDTPAYFNGRIYYAGGNDYLKAIALTNGLLAGKGVLTNRTRKFATHGATPSVSANGVKSGIVWALAMGTTQVLVACNATNFKAELYNSLPPKGSKDKPPAGNKFAVPTVADGKVFAGGVKTVTVFGLLGGTFAFSAANYSVAEANTNVTITVNRLGGTNGVAQISYATVAGGTAVSNRNYTPVAGILRWTSGQSGPKTFSVPVFNDGLTGPNPTIVLVLSTPTSVSSALGFPATAVLTIVKAAPNAWPLAHFGTNVHNAAIAGDEADPDHDGIPNLLEYAYATDPNVPDANPFTGAQAGRQFQLHFPRNTSASDLTYLVQASGDLSHWNNVLTYTAASGWQVNAPGARVSEFAAVGVPPDQFVQVTATTSTNVMAAATNQFLRLQIRRNKP